jgi:hypothetical protein
MWIGHMTGFLSLIGYMMISFFKRCASISSSRPNMMTQDQALQKRIADYKNNSALYQIWNSVSLLDRYISFVWPMAFSYWFADTYLRHTFKDDPFEVSMYELIIR